MLNRKDISTSNRFIALQHRHFAFIASVLRDSKPAPHWDANKLAQWESTVNSFIAMCKCSNGRFDAERFKAACNYERERA